MTGAFAMQTNQMEQLLVSHHLSRMEDMVKWHPVQLDRFTYIAVGVASTFLHGMVAILQIILYILASFDFISFTILFFPHTRFLYHFLLLCFLPCRCMYILLHVDNPYDSQSRCMFLHQGWSAIPGGEIFKRLSWPWLGNSLQCVFLRVQKRLAMDGMVVCLKLHLENGRSAGGIGTLAVREKWSVIFRIRLYLILDFMNKQDRK